MLLGHCLALGIQRSDHCIAAAQPSRRCHSSPSYCNPSKRRKILCTVTSFPIMEKLNSKRRCCQKKKCAGTQWRPRMGNQGGITSVAYGLKVSSLLPAPLMLC